MGWGWFSTTLVENQPVVRKQPNLKLTQRSKIHQKLFPLFLFFPLGFFFQERIHLQRCLFFFLRGMFWLSTAYQKKGIKKMGARVGVSRLWQDVKDCNHPDFLWFNEWRPQIDVSRTQFFLLFRCYRRDTVKSRSFVLTIKWKMWVILGEYPKFVPSCTYYIYIIIYSL